MVGFIHEIGTYYIALLFRTRAFGRYLSIPHKTQTGHHKDNRRLLSKAILLPPCNTGLQLSLLGLVRAFQRLVMHRSIVVSGKVKSSWCCRGLEVKFGQAVIPSPNLLLGIFLSGRRSSRTLSQHKLRKQKPSQLPFFSPGCAGGGSSTPGDFHITTTHLSDIGANTLSCNAFMACLRSQHVLRITEAVL